MTATIEKVEETLNAAGFEQKIPWNRSVFAGGDGNCVEDSPIGYYRFHFWKDDEHWKEHENWVSNTDIGGPFCISLMTEQQALGRRKFYRMLIRSQFGTKSVVLCEDDISSQFFDLKRISKQQILGIGLKEFINHEKDRISALEDDFGAMSIRTSCSVASISNDLVRSLPSSRLREAISDQTIDNSTCNNIITNGSGLSRSTSIRGSVIRNDIANTTESSPTVIASVKELSSRKKFRALGLVNVMELIKSFTQVKDKEFYRVLLDLEGTLDPKVFHFDVILANESIKGEISTIKKEDLSLQEEEEDLPITIRKTNVQKSSFQSFKKLLGEKLTKTAFQEQGMFLAKKGRVPSDLLFELCKERKQKALNNANSDKTLLLEEETKDSQENRIHRVTDFVLNEISYACKLHLIEEAFIISLDPTNDSPDPIINRPLEQVHYQGTIKGLMKGEDYKYVFAGLFDIIKLHSRLASDLFGKEEEGRKSIDFKNPPNRKEIFEKVKNGLISGKSIAEIMLRVCKEKELFVYASFLDNFNDRASCLKRLCEQNANFNDYVEFIAQDSRSNRLPIDQLMANLFQVITRYPLQLEMILKTTLKSDEATPLLIEAIEKVSDAVSFVEHCKKNRDDTADLFAIQRRILNCPPTIVQPNRTFIMKMAAYEVERGQVVFTKRLTLFLFNDLLLMARKRRNQKSGDGKLLALEKNQKMIQSHEFILSCPIAGATLKRVDVSVKTKKGQAKAFSFEIGGACTAWIANRIVALDDQHQDSIPNTYLLVPKKQEKLVLFIEKFSSAKHHSFLNDSPADVYFRQTDDNQDFYFHVYDNEMDYYNWQHKNRIAIVYADHCSLPDLSFLFPEETCDALMLVQALNGAFRFNIKCRETIVASSDCYEPGREFLPPEQVMRRFTTALVNCQTLHSIYPPFPPSLQLQMREQLERHIEPFSRGLFRKFKELANKLQKTGESIINDGGALMDDGASIYSVENSSIYNDEESSSTKGKKKSSLLGKVFGRLKSPLAKPFD